MKNILVIRNDKIGDFMLAWPAFAMLKQSMPKVEITALVPAYTRPLADLCPFIHKVLIDCGKDADKLSKIELIRNIKKNGFDASICLFSDVYNATLVWKVGIPFRLAPATKIFQLLYNYRVTQRRSQSLKPEYQYNLDLIRFFLDEQNIEVVEPTAPYLSFEPTILSAQRRKLSQSLLLDEEQPWLYIHVGSGGSANNLSLTQYAQLVTGMYQVMDMEIILTAGPSETEKAVALKGMLEEKNVKSVVYDKNDGLQDFTCSIACASVFIAGSTGPLHIAATIDVPTIGFFPSKCSATHLRWQPINSKGRHLAFFPPPNKNKNVATDMAKINIEDILARVNSFLGRVS
ncbi:glycosyltransferase family 9 protein [Candidatus Enterovibrio escicola]|uniref:glycosyltransferase family 9 protein n=1 Tax=Candidatus Enterovibrio escicola TaxID=1927127 RepID=UPI0012383326|nr:glycosyltransferase family 9 protein [Candidatus Enterovibrio escacola]